MNSVTIATQLALKQDFMDSFLILHPLLPEVYVVIHLPEEFSNQMKL